MLVNENKALVAIWDKVIGCNDFGGRKPIERSGRSAISWLQTRGAGANARETGRGRRTASQFVCAGVKVTGAAMAVLKPAILAVTLKEFGIRIRLFAHLNAREDFCARELSPLGDRAINSRLSIPSIPDCSAR